MEKVLIFDVAGLDSFQKKFEQFGQVVVDGREMTEELLEWPGWNDFDKNRSLLVFPGNGANIVRGFITKEWLSDWQWTGVYAKRFWKPGEDPRVIVDRVFPHQMVLGVQDVIVIDDVVSSGLTCKSLRRVNEVWLPSAHWHVASWLTQRNVSLKGYVKKFATKECGTKTKRASINSLSTLIQEREIAESYVQRNFPNHQNDLLDLLEEVRRSS